VYARWLVWARRSSLTGLFRRDGGGHGVVLGGGELAVVSDGGRSRLDARVRGVHRLLPLLHLRHAAVGGVTHCHAQRGIIRGVAKKGFYKQVECFYFCVT